MRCPAVDEIILYLDGELSLNRSQELKEHLAHCPACAARYQEMQTLVHRLAPDPGAFDEAALAAGIMSQLDQAPAAKPRRAGHWLVSKGILPAVVAAAAILVVLVLVWPERTETLHPGEFRSRGTGTSQDNRWLNLWVYQRTDRRRYQPVEQTITPEANLVFAYLDAKGTYRFLMIFAVDDKGHVFWFYPAHVRPGQDPPSIAISRGRRELPDEIQHRLIAGPLRLFALFSREPFRVSTIEQLLEREQLRRKTPVTRLERLPLDQVGQVSLLFHVTAP